MTTEKFEFKSEAKELLQLMTHSLYSSKDVFLRELISNASDALDKRRFKAILDTNEIASNENLEIRITTDKNKKTLTISDNGIGMTKEELIQNLGTIAYSGTKSFVQKLKESNSEEETHALIGQFGVGFYSAFIVANNVHVLTKASGSEQAFLFESEGTGDFSISPAEKDSTGTTITLFLKEPDHEDNLPDFTQEYTLKSTIKKYSDFVQYPIWIQEEVYEAENDDKKEENETSEPKLPKLEWKQANSMKAIWLKPESELTTEEYNEFYKNIAYDWSDPLIHIPIKAEGTIEYNGLLFIPSNPPFDLNYRDAKYGLRLHAQHVLIVDKCQELLPDYLRFVKGVVDSPDLNLNVSREILQKDRRIAIIKKHLTKKTLETIENLSKNDPQKFADFYENFSRLLKEGAASDYDNKEKLLKLLRFESTYTIKQNEQEHTDDDNTSTFQKKHPKMTSFEEYLSRTKPGQNEIYVISGETLESLKNSPHLEAFVQKDYEVLFLTDHYDEILFSSVNEFDSKKIKFIGRGEIELGTEEERKEQRDKLEESNKHIEKLLKALEKALENEVSSVRLSTRLTNSPACLVGLDGDISPHIQRLIAKMGNAQMPHTKRILELNPNHPLIEKLNDKYTKNQNDPIINKYAQLLYGQSLLAEASPLPDPIEYTKLVTELMVDAL